MTVVYVPVVIPTQPEQATALAAHTPGAAAASTVGAQSTPRRVFEDAIVQLAALDPIAALAAVSPIAALAALSPVLRLFNPAINVRAALLAFNPAAANALAIAGGLPTFPFAPWPLRR